ncbi:hypothetical protein ZYGR_0I04820 [Zygosaccharomyces rouxii]|uniref:2',3'-cyclic-nucleotide 3'-phosphodiesterase n=2 Tax=Zygosaccharomyces rouxii TaxID=4956 RepID=C5DTU8_ZYGRC|nr:uncharacterized protein ZYRO0C11462g [Zygosaccharomyces rouxii]KAH9201616.1 2',3'-cyclic-nucleotide 3'-phosphodiesterase [Zygosaccharomyces rouxii]GAV48185.1 hypothetical protein ZYGR_0I04820 [Zygosaccharomyces rouxii]CAR27209.1 ZYRO0C11462p [Zygosaccharomyces rouxii]
MAIALWYCPPQGSEVYENLQLLITSLQSLFPNSPVFEPHITITSDLNCNSADDVNKILTSCVAAIKSIPPSQPLVKFQHCTIGKSYFRKVVLECEPNRYLYSIAQIMRELYVEIDEASRTQRAATWARDEFKPHLSLLYSDVYPISQAFARIIQQRIEDALNVQLVKDLQEKTTTHQLQWNFSNEAETTQWNRPCTFKVVRCEGPVSHWRVLGGTSI